MTLCVFALLAIKNWEQLKGTSEDNTVDYGSCEQQMLNGVPHRKCSREQRGEQLGALSVPRGSRDFPPGTGFVTTVFV